MTMLKYYAQDAVSQKHGIRVVFLVSSILLVVAEKQISPVAWFLHISDLHVSEFHHKRVSDLNHLIQTTFPHFKFWNVLVTGDLVDGKQRIKRSEQREYEWMEYAKMMSTAEKDLGLSNASLIDMRGNHDTFDVPIRNGKRDFYSSYGVQKSGWSQGRILLHSFPGSNNCPIYSLVGIDLVPEIGLRSPTNFAGTLSPSIIQEFEEKIVSDMKYWYAKGCDPVYIGYGHYPLSIVASSSRAFVKDQKRLQTFLLKYGIHTWLCGHLHDAFGDHLFRIHQGDASTLLELEITDWKLLRRFRIIAVDDRRLSVMNFELEDPNASTPSVQATDPDVILDGVAILITSPSNPYFSPLGNRPVSNRLTEIKALVWPLESSLGALNVEAHLFCENTIWKSFSMNSTIDAFLYAIDAEVIMAMPCEESKRNVQVVAEIEGTSRISTSEKRSLTGYIRPKMYPHSLWEKIAFATNWFESFQNFFVGFLLFHVIYLLLIPKLFSSWNSHEMGSFNSRRETNGNKSDWVSIFSKTFMGPIDALITASSYSIFWWGQIAYTCLMGVGPWTIARVLSGQPHAIIFVPTVYISHGGRYVGVFSPEMPFRGCFFYLGVVLPGTLWMVWSIHRYRIQDDECRNRNRWVTMIYSVVGLISLFGFVFFVFTSWIYYGPISVFLSPIFQGWLLLQGLSWIYVVRSIPKSRKE